VAQTLCDVPVEVEEHVFTVDISGSRDPALSAEHTSWASSSLADALSVLNYGNCAVSLRRVDQFWLDKNTA